MKSVLPDKNNDKLEKVEKLIKAAEYYKNKNNDSCLMYLNVANQYIDKTKNYELQAKVYRIYGEFYNVLTDYKKAYDYLQSGYELASKYGYEFEEAKILNDIGGVYFNQKKYNEAESFYRKSLVKYDELNYKKGISATLNNIGETNRLTGNYDEAIKYYHKALLYNTENNFNDYVAINYINEALVHKELNKFDIAKSLLNKAFKIGKKIHNPLITSSSLLYLGNIYDKTSQPDSALYNYLNSLKEAKKSNDYKLMREINNKLYHSYYENQDYKTAIYYLNQYIAYNDTINQRIYNIEQNKYILQKSDFETTKNLYEKQLFKLKQQEKLQVYMGILFVALLILSLFLIIIYIKQKRLNKQLFETNKKLKNTLDKLNETIIKQRESESRYKNLFEESPYPILLVLNRTITLCNKSAENFFQTSRDNQLINKNIIEIIDDNSRNNFINAIKEVENSNKESVKTEICLQNFNDIKKTVILTVSSISYEGKNYLHFIFDDITERKENEEKFKSIFEGANIGILATDKYGSKFYFANPYICELTGYSVDELLNMGVKDLHPDDSMQEIRNIIEKQDNDRVKIGYNLPVQKKNGEIIYCDISSNLSIINHKEYFIGFFVDVTEKRKAQEALVKSEEKFRSFMETASDIMNIVDENLNITYVNKAFLDVLGYEYHEVIGKHISNFYHPDLRQERFAPEVHEEFVKKGKISFETVWVKKDGTPVYGNLKAVAIYDDKGNFIGSRGIFHDITERKKIEQDLIKAKEKAEESDRLKSLFLANISHEIRTPMNGIIGFAQLLKKKNLSEENKQKYIEIIQERSSQLLALIDNLIDYSKIESGQMQLVKESFSINDLLIDLYNFFSVHKLVAHNHVSLEYKLLPVDLIIHTDKLKLNQILINLLNNALKFTSTGKIIFGCRKQKNKLYFYVKDTGIGIPKDKHIIIFESFRQVDESFNKNTGGVGLGLSISKNLVNLLGGEINVASIPGKGSKFFFTIPVGNEIENVGLNNNKTSNYKWSDKTILIADDDEFNFYLLKESLSATEIRILFAKNGKQAIDFVNNENVDLILMDIKMPDIDGYTAAEKIKQINPSIKIIAQTAYKATDKQDTNLYRRFDSIIHKPINIDQLQKLINDLLNKT
ncbi:MAG: hypothetical protein Kow0068_17050 [Marinilabiliales bacterium]